MKLLLAFSKVYRIHLVLSLVFLFSSTVVAHEIDMDVFDEPEVIIVINGDSITTADYVLLLMKSHQTIPADQRADYDYNLLVKKLINDRLIIQEATAMGMDQEDMIVKPVESFRLSEAVSTFIGSVYKPVTEITEKAVSDRFAKNYKRAQLRTVAVTTAEEAELVYSALMEGASMDSIAHEKSFDSQAKDGGLHKAKFWKDILVPLREQALELKVNGISQPFKFEESFMVLKLEQMEEADPELLGHAESTIRKSLVLDHRKKAWENLMDSLATLYPIITNQETLGRISADSGVLLSKDFTLESDAPVLSIEGLVPVDEARFRKTLSHKAMAAAEAGFAVQVTNTMDELSETYLLEAGAIFNGYLDDPKVVSKSSQMYDSLLIEKYLQENIASQIIYDDEELKSIYDEHPDWWQLAADVKLKVMVCPDQPVADQALVMLRDGANYDYVNSRYGIENDYATTEDDWREAKSLPKDLAEKITTLSIGSFIDGIYQLSDGFAIFRLTARKQGKMRSFEEVLPNLQKIYFQQEFKTLMDQLIETLKKNSTIDLYEDRIARFLEG